MFDLAARTIDLHVYCPVAHYATMAVVRQARHGLPRRVRDDPYRLSLPVRPPDSRVPFPQVTARKVIHERPKADRFRRRWRTMLRPFEHVGNAQRQLARFEWFREIIISAYFETSDTAF